MDPFSALIFAMIASWAIMRSAAEAGVDQARAEARHAAAAIRKDLKRRQQAWAKQLNDRLEGGRAGGPATALWWGWAVLRTGKAIRRALRRETGPEEKARAIRGTAGPFRRIWDASMRGAKYAHDESRKARAAHERAAHSPVGVCGRCGAVAAASALAWALTRFGRQERMCAACRAAVDAERQAAQGTAAKPQDTPEPDVADADVVEPPVAAIDFPRERAEDTKSVPEPSPAPAPAPKRIEPPAELSAPAATPTAITPPEPEGDQMARPVVPYRPAVPAVRNNTLARRGGGDSYTHGAWNRNVADVRKRQDALPVLLEAMLSSLTSADAGREQVKGVFALREQIVMFMGEVEDMLRDVNRREMPVVDAVTSAGGPDEVPSIRYLADV